MTPEQIAMLQAPLDPKHVKPPPQGKYGSYVDGHHIVSEANRIFGHDGWSYDVKELRLTNASQTGDKHHVGYFAMVVVMIGDVRRTGVGHGSGDSKREGDAHESAVKEAETDALKRALRTFGNTFGLALYDKGGAPNIGKPIITDDQRAELMQMLDHLNVPVAEVLTAGKIKDLRDLQADRLEGLKSWINKRAIELREQKETA